MIENVYHKKITSKRSQLNSFQQEQEVDLEHVNYINFEN